MIMQACQSSSDHTVAMAAEPHLLSLPPQNQMDIILHILSFLSDNNKAAVAKLVCKPALQEFQQYKKIYAAQCSDLPLAYLADFVEQHVDSQQQQQQLMAAVAKQGDLDRLQFLRQHGCCWDWEACAAAAGAGHLSVLQWLRSQDPPCPWNTKVCVEAAVKGQLEVLQWLRAQQPPCELNQLVCFYAALDSQLKVLQWLHAQDVPRGWFDMVCVAAARNGNLEMLRWARSQNPPLVCNVFTCIQAANDGQLKVLQWLLAQDPPLVRWNEIVFIMQGAAAQGHLNILQWAASHQPPLPMDRALCLQSARAAGRTAVVEWLEALPADVA